MTRIAGVTTDLAISSKHHRRHRQYQQSTSLPTTQKQCKLQLNMTIAITRNQNPDGMVVMTGCSEDETLREYS